MRAYSKKKQAMGGGGSKGPVDPLANAYSFDYPYLFIPALLRAFPTEKLEQHGIAVIESSAALSQLPDQSSDRIALAMADDAVRYIVIPMVEYDVLGNLSYCFSILERNTFDQSFSAYYIANPQQLEIGKLVVDIECIAEQGVYAFSQTPDDANRRDQSLPDASPLAKSLKSMGVDILDNTFKPVNLPAKCDAVVVHKEESAKKPVVKIATRAAKAAPVQAVVSGAKSDEITAEEWATIKSHDSQMEATKADIKALLTVKYPASTQNCEVALLNLYTKGVNLEPEYQTYLASKDFSAITSYEEKVHVLAVSAMINPEFEQWLKAELAKPAIGTTSQYKGRLVAQASSCAQEAADDLDALAMFKQAVTAF